MGMQALDRRVLGYIELEVGSLAVKVPVCEAGPDHEQSGLAVLEANGRDCSIVVRGDTRSAARERAIHEAAEEAVRHLSRKLLN
jgi:hypothetical protein